MISNSLELVQRVPLFANAPAEALRQLLRTSELKVLSAGSLVYERGEQAKGAYLAVTATIGIKPPGGGEISESYGPGELVGELGLLSDVKRMHDAVVVRAGEILLIQRSEFVRLLEANPNVALSICDQLRESLHTTSRDLSSLRERFLDD